MRRMYSLMALLLSLALLLCGWPSPGRDTAQGAPAAPSGEVNLSSTSMDRGAKKVYGMRFGIQGLLDGQYVDLSDYIKNELDIEILKGTPSACMAARMRRHFSTPGAGERSSLQAE